MYPDKRGVNLLT